MREVDDALERAFALRDQADRPRTVPPAPHVPTRNPRGASTSSSESPAPRPRPRERPSCNGRRSF